MCRTVARALRPGGRFVTANSNPAFPTGRSYGYSRRVVGELVEGAPIVLEFFLPDGSFEATQVLAKHDENYMPPEAAAALEQARQAHTAPTLEAPQ